MKKIFILLIVLFFVFSCSWEKMKNIDNTSIKNYSQEFFAQIPVWDFKKELSNSWVILIDVRTPGELVKYWKISENQINIDINNENFPEKIEKLDKTKKYLIYCWHGNRSSVARDYMKSKWFSYVKDLKWWIDAWEKAWENIIK
jgi:rhodanese-related sulfurtransferase